MKKHLLFVAGLSFWVFACKKTEAPDGGNIPVFSVAYTVDSSYTITAGLNDVYLFTRFATELEVFTSTNSFTAVDCPAGDCPGSLTFEFRESAAMDSLFVPGMYRYTLPDSLSKIITSYNVLFSWGDEFQVFPEQSITISGNTQYTFNSPQQSALLVLPDSVYTIEMQAFSSNNVLSSIKRQVKPGNLNAFPGVTIFARQDTVGIRLTAISDAQGSAPVSYEWESGETGNEIIRDSLNFQDFYSVTVTDNFNNTASAVLGNLPAILPNPYRNATVGFASTPNVVEQKLGTVAIQWVDAGGVIWRSDRNAQPQDYFFTVMQNDPFEPNEKGDATRQLRVLFSCLLFNEAGMEREITGEGVIGMAYPR
jgi:hypothetical protein